MRIASLSPAATEMLFALGRGDSVVCRDQFSDEPAEAKAIPQLFGHQEISVEEVKRYQPDLVLTATVIQEALAAELKAQGFSVVHHDPRTLAGVEESIRSMGLLCEAENLAAAIVAAMRSELQAVKKRAAALPRRERVYVEEWHDPPMASGNWVPELVRIAGGEPFPLAAGELSRAVTLAEVAAFDPGLVVISWCGAGALPDKRLLTERLGWDALRAVREGRVRVIDDSLLNRPGPRLAEGAKRIFGWLFEQLH